MAIGGLTDKKAKITKFIGDVIDTAIARVDVDADSAPPSYVTGPLVRKTKFQVDPADLSYDGSSTPSAVPSSGGVINAAALADLFFHYAYSLTSIKRASFSMQEDAGVTTPIAGYNSRITALSSDYRMTYGQFRTAVQSGTDPLTNLQPGNVVAESALDDLIAKLNTVLNSRATTFAGVTNLTVCHNSCHTSCHGSRGRR